MKEIKISNKFDRMMGTVVKYNEFDTAHFVAKEDGRSNGLFLGFQLMIGVGGEFGIVIVIVKGE
jgi:hypothetical protein